MITIGHCRNCVHWVKDAAGQYVCDDPRLNDHAILDPAGQFVSGQLVYEWDEGGAMCPGPDFGCIHWQGTES